MVSLFWQHFWQSLNPQNQWFEPSNKNKTKNNLSAFRWYDIDRDAQDEPKPSTLTKNENRSRIRLPRCHVPPRLRSCLVCSVCGLLNRATPPLISTPKNHGLPPFNPLFPLWHIHSYSLFRRLGLETWATRRAAPPPHQGAILQCRMAGRHGRQVQNLNTYTPPNQTQKITPWKHSKKSPTTKKRPKS